MRSVQQLLEILINHLYQIDLNHGFCVEIHNLKKSKIYTNQEYKKLKKFISDNKPDGLGGAYWWDKGDKKSRISFIESLIDP